MFGADTDLNAEAVAGTLQTYKSIADKLLRNGEYSKAVKNYTKALTFELGNQLCLVARSKCYLMIGDNANALKDAEASLVDDKQYHKGIFRKAEALFDQGEFELALVFYHRGHNVRPELQNFLIGIKKAQEAIYNCVGTPERVKLNTSGDLSFFKAIDKKKVRNKGVACTKQKKEIVQRVNPNAQRTNVRTIKQMLADLYGDKHYLDKIYNETDNVTITGIQVRGVALEGIAFLNKRTEFWQQVKPIYARKYEALMALNRAKSSKISTFDYIVHELNKIDGMMVGKSFDTALARSLKLLTLLESYQDHQLTNKMIFMAAIHSAIGSAYFELQDYENAEKHHLLDLGLGEECYISEAEHRALDNLGRVYAASGQYQKAIDVWERKLPMTRNPLVLTWLSHEIGRCYLSLDDYEKAKEYGIRSLEEAQKAKDDRWQLHALVLISQSEVKSTRLSSALVTFEGALKLALLLNDSAAEQAIKNAIDGVHGQILEREKN